MAAAVDRGGCVHPEAGPRRSSKDSRPSALPRALGRCPASVHHHPASGSRATDVPCYPHQPATKQHPGTPRLDLQALAEPLSLSLVAHACLWLWLGSGGSGAARQAYPDDYAHRESADGLPGVARGCRLDFAAEPRRFEPALPLPAAASSRGDGGGGERGPPRDRQHGPQHHEKEEIEGGAPSEGGTSTGRGVHQEACTVAT